MVYNQVFLKVRKYGRSHIFRTVLYLQKGFAMLFRPKFCANCGENIDRAEWHIWTSRRFCDVCVAELPVHEYGPKVTAIVGFMAVLVAGGTVFRGGSSDNSLPLVRQRQSEGSNIALRAAPSPVPVAAVPPVALAENNTAVVQTPARTLTSIPVQKPELKAAADEVQYFCGAQTKKGTPCSRRVKGNIRCYQHQGMPAMVAADKLKIG